MVKYFCMTEGCDGIELIDGEWFFDLCGECNIRQSVKETLETEKGLLKPQLQYLPAKFLIFYNDITDVAKFEQAKGCPYFHCVFSVEEI